MLEQVIQFPNGLEWVVRAHTYSSFEESGAVFKRMRDRAIESEGNFSVWRSSDPDRTTYAIVICGRREVLPEIEGGEPYAISEAEAALFALRRARVALDKLVEDPDAESVTQESQHLDSAMTIDPKTGKIIPYR